MDKWISTFVYEKHLCGAFLKEGEIILKVNIYIETDNGSRKKMYRGYGALVEFYKKMDSLKQGKHMDAVMVHGILPI